MNKAILSSIVALFMLTLSVPAQDKVGKVTPTSETSVHDPVMIKQDSTYILFCTGMGIRMWSSTNMKDWKQEPSVFSQPPTWAIEAIPGFKGHIWAPDISYYNGLYYLYYSVSAFGKNTSCIGVATNKLYIPTVPITSGSIRSAALSCH